MPRRTQPRGLSGPALQAELSRLRERRRGLINIGGAYPYGSPTYQTASDPLRALDAVAEQLTGKREALLDPPHSVGGVRKE